MVKLYLALSCLQGRLFNEACAVLLALKPDGLQLTPGNVMTDAKRPRPPYRTHHGFSWKAMRQPVWSDAGELLVKGRVGSVHPPEENAPWCRNNEQTYEVMYPGYHLGTGLAVEKAMRDGLQLAVDTSHIFIQLQSGAMFESTWRKLREYEHITEVHVSANDGKRDTHRSITTETFGLDWARSRDVPIILESYMHRLSVSERLQQMDIVRGKQ